MEQKAAVDDLEPQARNRLLRRVDWRFLLSSPTPEKCICFTSDFLARAVACISDQMVEAGLFAAGCDLAVAVSPNDATLHEAWSALQPGGTLYTEWPRPLTGGPGKVRERLTAAGFGDVRCYLPWPWPSRQSARVWLPLDSRRALKFWLLAPLPARGGREGLRYLLRRLVWYLSVVAQPVLPVCAVAQRAEQPPSAADHSSEEDGGILPSPPALLRQWSSFDLGPPPSHLSCLLLTGGSRSVNKAVGLFFADLDDEPRLVVKMPRIPAASRTLRKEAENLRTLHATHEGIAGVPRLLFVQEQGGLTTLGQSALRGRPIGNVLRRENYRDLALAVTQWLVNFAGQAPPSSPALWWDRLVTPVLSDVSHHLSPLVGPTMIEATAKALAALGPLPLVPEHRDFGPYNILIQHSMQIAVLDWENAELQGLPALDLIYFLAYLGFYLDQASDSTRARRTYRAGLSPDTPTGSVQRECLDLYARQVGLDQAAIPPLRLLTWLVHCRWLCRFLTEEGAGRPDENLLRRSVPLAMWDEELRAQCSAGS